LTLGTNGLEVNSSAPEAKASRLLDGVVRHLVERHVVAPVVADHRVVVDPV